MPSRLRTRLRREEAVRFIAVDDGAGAWALLTTFAPWRRPRSNGMLLPYSLPVTGGVRRLNFRRAITCSPQAKGRRMRTTTLVRDGNHCSLERPKIPKSRSLPPKTVGFTCV